MHEFYLVAFNKFALGVGYRSVPCAEIRCWYPIYGETCDIGPSKLCSDLKVVTGYELAQ